MSVLAAGEEWSDQIDSHLNTADIILLLVSADFIASDYCYENEMKRAMERHESGDAIVIPVILRPVDWSNAPFAKLQALPKNGKAITTWGNIDEAFTDVAKGIRRLAQLQATGANTNNPAPPQITASTTTWYLEITGPLSDFDSETLNSVKRQLQSMSNDVTLRISNIEEGSILLTIESTETAYYEIKVLFSAGKLLKIAGHEILHVGMERPQLFGEFEHAPVAT